MKLYAEQPLRRLLQVIGDLLLVVWVWLWVSVGNTLHDATMGLAAPGRMVASAGDGLQQRFHDMASKVAAIPLVGGDIRAPFDGGANAARDLAGAGLAQVHAVADLAFWLRVAVIAIPVLMVAVVYLPLRARFVRRATAGRRFLDSADDLDLFALRAMTTQPLHVLARVSDDPAGAWRRRDAEVIDRLAGLQLAADGLRPPKGAVPTPR